MDESETAHRARPWRVHAIAHDFHLEDLWAFELGDRATADIRALLHLGLVVDRVSLGVYVKHRGIAPACVVVDVSRS
jgi:hypothetical protein